MREQSTQAMFTPLMRSTGAKNTSTVMMAKGTAARFMKGMRRPLGLLLRSLSDAIQGSVTASKMRQMKVMRPSTVSTPKTTRPVGT